MARKACFPGLLRRLSPRLGVYAAALAVGFCLGILLALVGSSPLSRQSPGAGRPGAAQSPAGRAAEGDAPALPVASSAQPGVRGGTVSAPAGGPRPATSEPRPAEPALPASGRILAGYGWVRDPVFGDWRYHTGVDIEAPVGAAVRACLSGSVVSVTEDDILGRCVTVEHETDGRRTLYAHCGRVLVDRGTEVQGGQVIALVGTTGLVSTPHLHFEVLDARSGANLDPLDYVRGRGSQP